MTPETITKVKVEVKDIVDTLVKKMNENETYVWFFLPLWIWKYHVWSITHSKLAHESFVSTKHGLQSLVIRFVTNTSGMMTIVRGR